MSDDIWAVWPSANPKLADKCAALWNAAGYKTAVLIDDKWDSPLGIEHPSRVIWGGEWKGYPNAMNLLCREVPGDVVVCISDDILPPKEETKEVIYSKFMERFPDTFGVMQPTGDKFGSIDICCPCPWIGRAFIDEAYGGSGPYNTVYFHYYSDKEIMDVAVLMDAFQARPDLTQYHDHWQRGKKKRPQHLQKALERWKKDKNTCLDREAAGYPGHERSACEPQEI